MPPTQAAGKLHPKLNRLHFAAGLILLLIAFETAWLHALAPLENRLSDFFVRTVARQLTPDPDIVIVDIDEASLAKMQDTAGNWPWPRAVHGELVSGIAKQHPKAIVFDILFSERDVYRPESDRLFNESLRNLSYVYFPMLRLNRQNDARSVPLAQIAGLLGIQRGATADPAAHAALLPPLAIAPEFWRAGINNFTEDADGIGRRYLLYLDADGWKIPSLPARIAADIGYPIPQQPDLLLHWRGDEKTFQRISYADLYVDFGKKNSQRDAQEFTNKIVIVGTTATGLHDIRATPVASLYPGVAILATAIDNLKNRRYMRSAPAYAAALLAFALVLAQLRLFQRRIHAIRIAALLLAASLLLLAAEYGATAKLWIIPVLAPLLFAWAFYFSAALLEYLREKKSREQAVRIFSRFLDPRVVDDLVAHGETPQSLSGQAREITVLFSDIRGFTTLSESHTPEEVVALLNRYFSLQVDVIFRHGGTLDKFIGDAIMAFWGAPHQDDRQAVNAVAAALEMEQRLLEFRKELGAAGESFDVGIGIHSGPAVVGFIGSEHRLEYTAIGDTVNLASRIEGLTKGVARILVSHDTLQRCGTAFDFAARGSYKVKGRTQEVELFEPRVKTPAL